ncbi:MAG: fucose isomerase, partial [Clostridia bacterium]|nr:fucose isomerase [Clostridia bacterium]
KDAIVIRMDGHGVPEILDAILTVFPLDTYVEKPAILMQLMASDVGKVETPIWDVYADIITKHENRGKAAIGNIDRFDFYDEAKKCYCIIATGESAIYANIMLQKGVI